MGGDCAEQILQSMLRGKDTLLSAPDHYHRSWTTSYLIRDTKIRI